MTTGKANQLTRLARFRVEGLFGEYTYTIPVNIERHVTAIIAPNGSGKTLCLRMMHAFFRRKWAVFSELTYVAAHFAFTTGEQVTIAKGREAEENDAPSGFPFLIIRLRRPGYEDVTYTPRLIPEIRKPEVERYLPFLTRVGPSKWRHDHTGEMYDYADLFENFANVLPPHVLSTAFDALPDEIDQLTRKIDCRLIETQRLLVFGEEQVDPPYRHGRHARSTLAIARKATTLKEIIAREITAYASLSQSLDRSFPRRVVQQQSAPQTAHLKEELARVEEQRLELTNAGILDRDIDEPVALPSGPLEPAVARVLNVYVDDMGRKLRSLSNILSKIKLFKLLIDERFRTKDVKISKQNGIEVFSRNKHIPLEQLSSGEQHQLVLFFELLFEIGNNALILIDEPELSLHVAWQKKFISDLMKIIELNKFDVVLATHSPQLIGRWNDLVVELGDVYEGASSNDGEA